MKQLRATALHVAGLAVAGIAGAAILMGCAGSSGGEQAAEARIDNADEVVPAEANAATDSANSDASSDTAPRTLADYVGNAAAGPGQRGAGGDEDEVIERQRRIQQAIQICMQSQGFEYTPEEVGDGLQFFLATQSQGTDPADYAATQGFGISTRFDALLEGDIDLDEASNPNDDYVATLSQGEADAWNIALNGVPPERNAQGQIVDPETGDVVQGGRRGQVSGGCQLEAQTQVRGDAVILGDLEGALALLASRIEADPRIAAIKRQWVDCMREEGFDYTDEADARSDMNTQLRPLLRSFFASGDTDPQAGDGNQGRPGGGGNQLQAISGLQLTAEQELALDALQDLERSIAVASLMCQGDTGQEIDDITAAYEAEFIDDNRAALEALSS